jgi:hypothetical protein
VNCIEAVCRLVNLGYRPYKDGEGILLKWEGPGDPDPVTVSPLLDLVRRHKDQVRAYLSRLIQLERILTCFDCGHFRPAVNSPNPTQAWGHCEKRDKGRYGVATACEAALTSPGAPREAISSKA